MGRRMGAPLFMASEYEGSTHDREDKIGHMADYRPTLEQLA